MYPGIFGPCSAASGKPKHRRSFFTCTSPDIGDDGAKALAAALPQSKVTSLNLPHNSSMPARSSRRVGAGFF